MSMLHNKESMSVVHNLIYFSFIFNLPWALPSLFLNEKIYFYKKRLEMQKMRMTGSQECIEITVDISNGGWSLAPEVS